MEKPLVSIIVPVYNVENYLNKCLDSLLAQSYSNLEIIIINDGSPDNSQLIIDKYIQKDNRINCFIKENGGLSSARNKGIELATGEYISFIDSDDWIDKDMIKKLVHSSQNNKSDIAICDVSNDYENGKIKTILQQAINYPTQINTREKKDTFLALDCFACNKLFKTSLFKENNIKFPEGILYEDIATFPRLFFRATSLSFVKEPLYHYIIRKGAITQTFKIKGLDYFIATDIVKKDIEKNYPEFTEFIKPFQIMHLYNSLTINSGYLKNNKERSFAFKKIKTFFKDENISWNEIKNAGRNTIPFWNYRSKAQKIYYAIFWFANPILRIILTIFHSIKK